MDTAATFGLLADETRVEILRQLLAAERADPGDPAVSFATLQRRCDVDRSNRLSYHLDELEGTFVTRTDEGGYRFTAAGWGVARAILRGTHAAGDEPVDDIPLESTCSACDGPLQVVDDEGIAVIECADCDTVHTRYFLPPGALEGRDPGARAAAFDALVRRELALAADEVCPRCLGVTAGTLERREDAVHARYVCERCGNVLTEALRLRLRRHPAVVAFHRDHGVDPSATPHWDAVPAVEYERVIVVERPLQVQARLRAPNETLRITVDTDLSVTVDGVRETAPDRGDES